MQLYHAGHLGLPALWRALALNPARLLGLDAGRLAPGAPADLVLFDPDTPFVLDRATLRSKSKNTPYDLRRMQGRVLAHLGRRRAGLRAGGGMTLASSGLRPRLPRSARSRSGCWSPARSGSATSGRSGRGTSAPPTCCGPATRARRAATLVLDAGKGAVAVLIARAVAGEQAALVAGTRAPFSGTSSRCGSGSAAARGSRPSSGRCWRWPGRRGSRPA